MATRLIATAHSVSFEGFAPCYRVVDAMNGRTLGTLDMIRGFAHYTGARGSVHEGVTAVIAGGPEALRTALDSGLNSGRDDRN